MSYHEEKVDPTPTLMAIIENVKSFDRIDRLPCPYCNGQMWRVVGDEWPYDEFKGSTILHRERYYCENCDTHAGIVQEFRPSDLRKMTLMRDMVDD